MKRISVVSGMAALVCACATFVLASSGGAGISADEALNKLLEGNKRYVDGKMNSCGETTTAARETLAKGQKPYAIILSCSDSRVPPEIIFDKTFGEIFVVRVAGNVPDPVVLGSIEYAAEHLGSPLIVVLGHERCGAVTAAVDAKGKPTGNIGAIIKTIAPAVKRARIEAAGKEKKELVETAIDVNVRLVAENVTKQSPILKHLAKEGKVKIVAAKYDLDDGKVTLLDTGKHWFRRQIRLAIERMNHITQEVSVATREQAIGSKQIRIAVENMNRVTGQVNIATKEQSLSARQIVKAVNGMASMTQSVANATAEQKKGGEMVVKATENISELTRENLSSVEQLSRAAQSLSQQAIDLAALVAAFKV